MWSWTNIEINLHQILAIVTPVQQGLNNPAWDPHAILFHNFLQQWCCSAGSKEGLSNMDWSPKIQNLLPCHTSIFKWTWTQCASVHGKHNSSWWNLDTCNVVARLGKVTDIQARKLGKSDISIVTQTLPTNRLTQWVSSAESRAIGGVKFFKI